MQKSSLARQHPHRAGRIRVDRQFTTNLSIGSIGDMVDTTERGANKEARTDTDNAVDSSNKKDLGDMSTDSSGDDDDDDDDVLLFVPFTDGE